MRRLLAEFKNELWKDTYKNTRTNFRNHFQLVRVEIDSLKFQIAKNRKKVIIYSLEKDDHENYELSEQMTLKLMVNDLKFEHQYTGKKADQTRPTLIKFNSFRYKLLVLKQSKTIEPGMVVAEDFIKNKLKIRKKLIPKMSEVKK